MKKVKFLGTAITALIFYGNTQVFAGTALEYMNSISLKYRDIQTDMWEYTKAAAHGKSAKKIDSKRTELIKTTYQSMSDVKQMPDYEGDGSYRDSVVAFLNIYYIILKEDYAKIVDMEDIAEKSYDNMEAYMMAKEIANQKMESASQMVAREQRAFADKHGIKLLEADDDLTKKMTIAGDVYKYYNPLYLIFFKSYIQEKYLTEAINNKDVSAIEQNKNALSSTAKEGLEKAKTISAYNGDNSILTALVDYLTFCKDEADNRIAAITDYFIKTENFTSIKTSFDEIKENKRTQADVDRYNGAVKEMNDAVAVYNSTNAKLGADRTKYLDGWNNSVAKFTDKHVPKGKGK